MTLSDIAFAHRYRAHVDRTGRQARPSSYWDGRAIAMGLATFDSRYARAFVERVDLTFEIADPLVEVRRRRSFGFEESIEPVILYQRTQRDRRGQCQQESDAAFTHCSPVRKLL